MVPDNLTNSSVVITFRHFCDLYVPKRTMNNTLNKHANINATKMYGMMILTICLFLLCICLQGSVQYSGDFIHKCKGKVCPRTSHEGPKGNHRYSSTPRPVRFTPPPGNTRYLLYRRLCGPQSRHGEVRRISLPPGFDHRTVQFVASRYID